jgi:hypothetical protein
MASPQHVYLRKKAPSTPNRCHLAAMIGKRKLQILQL